MGIPISAILEGLAALLRWKAADAELKLKERVVNQLERLEDEYEQLYKELDEIWRKIRNPGTDHDTVNGLLQKYEDIIVRIARRGKLRSSIAKRCVALGWRPDDPDARRTVQTEAKRSVHERKTLSEIWGEGSGRSEGDRSGGTQGQPKITSHDKADATT